MGLTPITIGYVPLLDAAVLIAAQDQGFAAAEGLEFDLVRETSWANIRDRVAIGHFDAAHMLAPMPLSANLGLTPLDAPMIAPMALGLGGNAVTVSNAVWEAMREKGALDGIDARAAGLALLRVIEERRRAHLPKLRFGVVHPESGHNYELRYWLAASGIAPGADIEIVIVPPSFQPDALAAGRIDGYCVGEPFNSVGVARGVGRIVTTKSAIWRSSPEKVLGTRAQWAERYPERLGAMIRAITRAARWCSDPANQSTLARLLSGNDRLGIAEPLLMRALTGELFLGADDVVRGVHHVRLGAARLRSPLQEVRVLRGEDHGGQPPLGQLRRQHRAAHRHHWPLSLLPVDLGHPGEGLGLEALGDGDRPHVGRKRSLHHAGQGPGPPGVGRQHTEVRVLPGVVEFVRAQDPDLGGEPFGERRVAPLLDEIGEDPGVVLAAPHHDVLPLAGEVDGQRGGIYPQGPSRWQQRLPRDWSA
jgi:two-component system, oxyanion-binding sensor